MKCDFIEPRCERKAIRHPTVQSLTHKRRRVVISCIMAIMGMLIKSKLESWRLIHKSILHFVCLRLSKTYATDDLWINLPSVSTLPFSSYNTYSNEVGYGSPYGYPASVTPQQTMGYDISADYVDSTTTYEPRSTIIDTDFIGGRKFELFLPLLFEYHLTALWLWVLMQNWLKRIIS